MSPEAPSFTLWVDADACPGLVKELILKTVQRKTITTVFVANKPISIPNLPYLSTVQVAAGPDVADQYIVSQAQPGDLVISQDIPLAGELVPKGIAVISPHGTIFTDRNIGDRVSVRNLMQDLRDTGMITGGPKPFGEKEKRQFANALDQVVTKLCR